MPKKTSNTQEKLARAQKEKLLVRFARTFESGTLTGYIVDVGPQFFVLAVLNDGFEFEQYTCLRAKDVRRLECPAKHAEFYTRVRKLRGDRIPRKTKLDLSDAKSILYSASPSLVTIHLERQTPACCYIGCGISDNGKFIEMIEIDTDARWESESTYYKLKDITRIDLPGPYEKALLLVGGYLRFLQKKTLDTPNTIEADKEDCAA